MLNWFLSLIKGRYKTKEPESSFMYVYPSLIDRIPVELNDKFGIKGIDYMEIHNIVDGTTRRI